MQYQASAVYQYQGYIDGCPTGRVFVSVMPVMIDILRDVMPRCIGYW